MKKIRLVSGKQAKKAYGKNKIINKVDLNEEILKKELGIENVEELPKEMFSILGEILLFIDSANKMEGDKNENK
ncbi:MAG: hypothetical protein GX981_11230 [Tissierellia bacterium]|nr:hypothetical protein [Tissierellia bacterium]